ncbi:MAG: hypothetical protein KAS32_09040, partial [Candidatus Peribacteraceae bacterium]|nr:hypothetical protein [Candidatus Peribacteraceae bacterium]
MYICMKNFKNSGINYPKGAEYSGVDAKYLLKENLIADIKELQKKKDDEEAQAIENAKKLAAKAKKNAENDKKKKEEEK